MFGAVTKEILAHDLGIKKEDVVVVSIMPCTAKKFEAKRPEFTMQGILDVDNVLTTQEQSRKYVHSLRAKYDAVLIGSETARTDNPKLTVRLAEGRNPYRIILDSKLRLNPDLNLFKNNTDKKTIIVTLANNASKKSKIKKLEQLGVKIVFIKKNQRWQGRFI